MNKNRNPNNFTFGHVVGAVIFILIMIGLIVFAAGYDPESQFNNSFFEDVSNAVQWR